MRISDLDNTKATINSVVWRFYCLGKTGGSDSTWASYRKLVGVGKRLQLTQRQAFLMLVRSKITQFYSGKVTLINILTLENLANRWLSDRSSHGWYALLQQLDHKSDLDIYHAKSLYEDFTGLNISMRTFRRRCENVGFKLDSRMGVSSDQLQLLTGMAIKNGWVSVEFEPAI
jgi:hypothetical protein